jgi:hypothetical protein
MTVYSNKRPFFKINAEMAKLVDARDSKSRGS